MSDMLTLLRALYPLRLAPVSADTDKAVARLCEELDFTVHEYESGSEYNGWIIPQKWEVKKAEIYKDGKLIYDGMHHPLGVIGYSQSFHGEVDLDTLREHLYYSQIWPDALVYYYRLFYRNWESQWGFSVPQRLYHQLKPGTYQVDLQTVHEPGTMKVCDCFLPGDNPESIVFLAHNCHAGQANDDIAGVVVGVELLRRLAKRKSRRYSYRLLIGPEQFSSIFYLASRTPEELKRFKYGFYLEVLGIDNRIALQRSFYGDSKLDRAAEHYLNHHHPDCYIGDFRQILGNDETVWEAPGYEVPTISLSRANPIKSGSHYPEYHTSRDNEDCISESMLEESVQAVMDILQILETDSVLIRNFNGLIALSNPMYDLFFDSLDPAIKQSLPEEQELWVNLMTRLQRYMDGSISILDIAEQHGIAYETLYGYIKRYKDKGLVKLRPAM
jgi:aminopeptidase-like protein